MFTRAGGVEDWDITTIPVVSFDGGFSEVSLQRVDLSQVDSNWDDVTATIDLSQVDSNYDVTATSCLC